MTIPFDLIYILPLFLSAIVGLKTFRLQWPFAMKGFSVFLITTLIVELFAISWKYGLCQTKWWHYTPNNLWIYNIYLLPQYLFYIYFFSNRIQQPLYKYIVPIIAVAYLTLTLINLLFIQGLFAVNYISIIAANLIMIFFSISYFISLLKAESVVRLSKQPLVWIAVGAFIFHLGSLPCFVLYNSIFSENMVIASSLFRIIISLNFIMYLTYAIAFLCTQKYPTSPF